MDPFLDTFCTRFAAGAGSQWVWRLTDSGCLRTPAMPQGSYCPLAAQSAYESGIVALTPHTSMRAFRAAGYPDAIIEPVILAADHEPDCDQELRQRLLRICSLEEVLR